MSWYPKSTYIQKRKASGREKWERHQDQKRMEIVVAVNRVADELAATEKQEKSSEKKKGQREWLTIFLIFATVLATGLGDYIFYRTMEDARETASAQHTDTTALLAKAAEANVQAHRQADEAKRQADDAERAFRDLERPYVFIDIGDDIDEIMSWYMGNAVLRKKYWAKNYGKGPAKIAGIGCSQILTDGRFPSSADLQKVYDSVNIDPIVASGGTSKELRCTGDPPVSSFEARPMPEAHSDLQDKMRLHQIWIIGKVEYEGFLGNKYLTTFCYAVVRPNSMPIEAGEGDCNKRT